MRHDKRSHRSGWAAVLIPAMLLTALTASGNVYANAHSEYTGYCWYVRRNADHRQPAVDPMMAFIEGYDCFYVDKAASEQDKVIYLTFDCGYENGNIARILDTLKAHDAVGAFFILENMIDRAPDIVKRMAAEGHTVCNHTLRHWDMTKVRNSEEFSAQLQGLKERYKALTGQEMADYYRPPEGRFSENNLKILKELGYKTVLWSFAYADWDNEKQPSREYAMGKITDNLHNGAILLLHPTSATNAAIMDELLTKLEADGYRFGTLDELAARNSGAALSGETAQ